MTTDGICERHVHLEKSGKMLISECNFEHERFLHKLTHVEGNKLVGERRFKRVIGFHGTSVFVEMSRDSFTGEWVVE